MSDKSDKQVLKALARFGPILHEEIENPRTSRPGNNRGRVANWDRYDNSLPKALRLSQREIAKWDKHYGIKTHIAEEISAGNLVVDDGKVPYGQGYRLNLSQAVFDHGIRDVKNPDVEFYLRAYAYVGYNRPGQAYNAFISMDINAKQDGKWVLSQVEGTGHVAWSPPVFSPFYIARTSIWFNTSIKEHAQNTVTADDDLNDPRSMHHGELHRLDSIHDIEVPNDPRLHFFFWQLSRLMRPRAWFSLRPALM